MGASLRLGRILGIPINIHFSWIIVFVLCTFLFQEHFDQARYSWSAGERWVVGLATSLMLFVSVLAHELSHSLVAINRGIPVKGITLLIFGGVAQLGREARRPSTEFVIAVVGPLSSVILGLLFLGLAFALDGVSSHLAAIASLLVWVNIVLAVFNMLPGFPMDGGRVLRAVVWKVTGNYRKATRLATFAGQAVAFTIVAAGVAFIALDTSNAAQGARWIFLGLFIWMLASASQRQSRLGEELQNYTARDVMEVDCPTAPISSTLGLLMESATSHLGPGGRDDRDFVVIVEGSNATGLINRRLIQQVPQARWFETSAASIMAHLNGESSEAVPVQPEDSAYDVMEMLDETDAKLALVIEDGVPLGFIRPESMRRFVRASDRVRT